MIVELPIVCFFSLILVLIPLPAFWRAKNYAAIAMIGWLCEGDIVIGVNAIVWAGSTVVKYPVWCDITTKLAIGSNVAVPALLVCLCRYLAVVASGKNILSDAVQKRRRAMLELFAGIGLPIVHMALHYIVQGHRFDIYEDLGCTPTVYFSVAALFIIYLPRLLLSLGVLIYAGIALVYFIRRRTEVLTTLRRSQSALTPGAYLRLIAVSVTMMVCVQSITIWIFFINFRVGGFRPWTSWEDVHSYWLVVDQWPLVLQEQAFMRDRLVYSHLSPFASIMFFAFFGLGQSVRAEYTEAWQWVRRRVLRIQPKPQPVLPLSSHGEIKISCPTIATPVLAKLKLETPPIGAAFIRRSNPC